MAAPQAFAQLARAHELLLGHLALRQPPPAPPAPGTPRQQGGAPSDGSPSSPARPAACVALQARTAHLCMRALHADVPSHARCGALDNATA